LYFININKTQIKVETLIKSKVFESPAKPRYIMPVTANNNKLSITIMLLNIAILR